jgi:subtilisin family serine protease
LINMSWGGPESDQLHEAIIEAASAGCYSICAAGNHGRDSWFYGDYPGAWDEVICVGSVGWLGQVTEFSSRNRSLDLVTPGKRVKSCWPPDGYKHLSGTSMSAPMVTGEAANCMIAHDKVGGGQTPIWCLDALRMHLIRACDQPILTRAGWNRASGFGILDPKMLAQEETV